MLPRKWIMIAAAVLMAALPAEAMAKPGKTKDKTAKVKKSKKGSNVVLSGTVASVDVATGVVSVTVTSGPGGTNKAGQQYRGQTVQFNVTDAKLQVGDANGDGTADLNDVVAGDAAQVQAKLGSADAQPFAASRFKDVTSLEDEEEEEPEVPETEETPPAT